MPKRNKQPLPPAVTAYMSALGRKGGTISGARRMTNLTPKQRQAVARAGARARWNKKKADDAT